MIRLSLFATSLFSILLFAAPAAAQSFAIGPKISTLGPGLEAAFRLSNNTNLRIGAQGLSMTRDIEETDVHFEGELDFMTGNLLLDYHPGGRSFRFTIGGYAGDNEVLARSTEETILIVNDVPYRVADVGRLEGTITPASAGPYAGIGFGNPFSRARGWSASLDIGAWYWDEPEVKLIAVPNPGVPLPPGYEADLAAEEAELQEEISAYKIAPVISFAVRYTF
jgi:hypothetical protein